MEGRKTPIVLSNLIEVVPKKFMAGFGTLYGASFNVPSCQTTGVSHCASGLQGLSRLFVVEDVTEQP